MAGGGSVRGVGELMPRPTVQTSDRPPAGLTVVPWERRTASLEGRSGRGWSVRLAGSGAGHGAHWCPAVPGGGAGYWHGNGTNDHGAPPSLHTGPLTPRSTPADQPQQVGNGSWVAPRAWWLKRDLLGRAGSSLPGVLRCRQGSPEATAKRLGLDGAGGSRAAVPVPGRGDPGRRPSLLISEGGPGSGAEPRLALARPGRHRAPPE
jgi:hypothetical protein